MKIRNTSFVFALLLVASLVVPVRAELVGYWDFDASNATDLSVNGNNGSVGSAVTFTGDTPWGAGLAAQSIRTGASIITVPDSPSMQSVSQQMSISFWMKAPASPENANWFRLFQKGTEAQYAQSWMINRYDVTSRMNMRVDTNLAPGNSSGFNQNIANSDTTTILDNQWHHLVFTMDNGQWRKYVDGVAKGSGGYTHHLGFANTRPLYMLGRNGNGEYAGLLDEVGLWNTPLDAAQSRTIYTVPMNLNLNYDLGDLMTLWDIHAMGPGGAGGIEGIPWQYAASLPGSPTPGDAYVYNNVMYIALGPGTGLAAIPEPSTLALAGLGALGLIGFLGRRKRR